MKVRLSSIIGVLWNIEIILRNSADASVSERGYNFKELISVDASVSECLSWSILETSPSLSKILTVMNHNKKVSVMNHF